MVTRLIRDLRAQSSCRVDLLLFVGSIKSQSMHPIYDHEQLIQEWSVRATDEPPLFIFRSADFSMNLRGNPLNRKLTGFQGVDPRCTVWYEEPPIDAEFDPVEWDSEHTYYLEDFL